VEVIDRKVSALLLVDTSNPLQFDLWRTPAQMRPSRLFRRPSTQSALFRTALAAKVAVGPAQTCSLVSSADGPFLLPVPILETSHLYIPSHPVATPGQPPEQAANDSDGSRTSTNGQLMRSLHHSCFRFA
jgi:hypothetical protein